MSNPWDPPHLPKDGDPDIELTYAGVGNVMSQWEGVEVTLSHLYSHFVGKEYQAEAMHEYGKPQTFRERLKILNQTANRYFCDQVQEADFDRLTNELIGYSNRRNDIAHGIVRPCEWYQPGSDFVETYTWWLVPAHYKPKKTDLVALPSYAYNRHLMDDIGQKILSLNHRLLKFQSNLFPPRIQWD